MPELVNPHGNGALKPLLVPESERPEELRRAEGMPRITMPSREASDVLMMGMGAYTPIDGFMGEADWRGACLSMKLGNGIFWPIPITLSCSVAVAETIKIGHPVALADPARRRDACPGP